MSIHRPIHAQHKTLTTFLSQSQTGGAWLAYGTKSDEDGDGDGGDTDDEVSDEDIHGVETGNPRYDSRGALRRPLVSVNKPDADASGRGDDGGTNSGATTLRGQTTNENTRLVVDAIHAVGSTSDDGDVTFSVDESADDDTVFFADETFDEGDEKQATDDDDTSQETTEARTAAGYKLGSHLDNMQGGKKTELVVNAANAAEVGIRVGVVEDGALVETWYEARAGPGEGMRVGDVYLGVVAKVIGGMQGVLVDVTGKGPPFALMQKGVDEPALAWRKADELYEREVAAEIETLREMEMAGNTSRDTSGDTAGNTSGDSSDGETTGDTLETGDDDSDSASAARRIERLERKARNSSSTETKLGGRWADAWAEGVGVSDSFDVGTLQGIDGGSRGRHASVAMRLDGVKVDDGDDDKTDDAIDGATLIATVVSSSDPDPDPDQVDAKYRKHKTPRNGGTVTRNGSVTDASHDHPVPQKAAHHGWAPWRRGGGVPAVDLGDAGDDAEDDAAAHDLDHETETQRDENSGEWAERKPRPQPSSRGVADDWVPGMPVVVQGKALRISQIRQLTVLPLTLVTVVHTSRYTRPAKGRLLPLTVYSYASRKIDTFRKFQNK